MNEKIKVIFRKFEDGQVIALFPNEKEEKGFIMSYMAIGQHSSASVDLVEELDTCNSKEVAQGIKMLQGVGYTNLVVSKG